MAGVFEVQVLCAHKGGDNAISFRSPDRTVVANPDGQIVLTGLAQTAFDALKVGQNYKLEISTLAAVVANEPTSTDKLEEMQAQPVAKPPQSVIDRISAIGKGPQHGTSKP